MTRLNHEETIAVLINNKNPLRSLLHTVKTRVHHQNTELNSNHTLSLQMQQVLIKQYFDDNLIQNRRHFHPDYPIDILSVSKIINMLPSNKEFTLTTQHAM